MPSEALYPVTDGTRDRDPQTGTALSLGERTGRGIVPAQRSQDEGAHGDS